MSTVDERQTSSRYSRRGFLKRAGAGVGTDGAAVERGAERARLAAEALSREGTRLRYLRSIFVPEDETCFYLYEAASADAVRIAAERAALPFERVAEAVTTPRGESR